MRNKERPTKRALDAGDSAAFSSIFLASGFSCSPAESTPAPVPVTQAVNRLITKMRINDKNEIGLSDDCFSRNYHLAWLPSRNCVVRIFLMGDLKGQARELSLDRTAFDQSPDSEQHERWWRKTWKMPLIGGYPARFHS